MLHNNIFRDIDDLSKHINNIYESIFKKYGLHRGQFAFITRIVENEQISLRELAENLRLDKTSVTRAVQKLESAGYVIKTQDIDDSRLFHLTITPKGLLLYQNIIEEKNRIIDKILDAFSPVEIKLLTDLIQRLNTGLS